MREANAHVSTNQQEDREAQAARKSIRTVAERAAREAGALIRARIGQPEQLRVKTSGRDLVTEVDKACERTIREIVQSAFPAHEILGEEAVAPGTEASIQAERGHRSTEHLWIVDPIDGTTSFIHGFPGVSVSIAYARHGVLEVGVVYDPIRDELFAASLGSGTTCNGQMVRVDDATDLSTSLLSTGFPGDAMTFLPANLRTIILLAPKCRGIRSIGSAALHLAYVAAGRLTGFWEYNLSCWDVAAGAILVAEAGGNVSNSGGEPFDLSVRHIVATNGRTHDELIAALAGEEERIR